MFRPKPSILEQLSRATVALEKVDKVFGALTGDTSRERPDDDNDGEDTDREDSEP